MCKIDTFGLILLLKTIFEVFVLFWRSWISLLNIIPNAFTVSILIFSYHISFQSWASLILSKELHLCTSMRVKLAFLCISFSLCYRCCSQMNSELLVLYRIVFWISMNYWQIFGVFVFVFVFAFILFFLFGSVEYILLNIYWLI